jgi:hypothetical protein
MNHCRDCNSDYATPGTCNCFAPNGKRAAAPYVPYYPYPWQIGPTVPWWQEPYRITWQPCTTTLGNDWSGVTFQNNEGTTPVFVTGLSIANDA